MRNALMTKRYSMNFLTMQTVALWALSVRGVDVE